MLKALKLEFQGADLGDQRREARLERVAAAFGREPAASIPDAMETVAGLEATYRLLGNEAVLPEDIHEAHRLRTIERAFEAGRVRVLHDTTEARFGGADRREGLGWLDGKGQGYFLHGALVTRKDGLPLGLVAFQTLFREGEPRGKGERPSRREDYRREDKETRRWEDVFDVADASLAGIPVTHVFDAGADDFHLLSQVQKALGHKVHQGQSHAIFRARHDRKVHVEHGAEPQKLFKVWGTIPATFTRKAKVSERKEKQGNRKRSQKSRDRHPPRAARTAFLEVRAAPVTLSRPNGAPATLPKELKLNAVSVKEPNPPAGQEPIEWLLLTTAPIATADDVRKVVDGYCGRWPVEEYWKALKTGCALEKRQLETRRSHLNALAIFIPIAWQILSLKNLSRGETGDEPCAMLTDTQQEILRAAALKSHKLKLPKRLTNRDALLAIAALGGHIKNNGDPGWMVIGRGYERLLIAEWAWLLAVSTGAIGSDQS